MYNLTTCLNMFVQVWYRVSSHQRKIGRGWKGIMAVKAGKQALQPAIFDPKTMAIREGKLLLKLFWFVVGVRFQMM